jgi:hypothetical protein
MLSFLGLFLQQVLIMPVVKMLCRRAFMMWSLVLQPVRPLVHWPGAAWHSPLSLTSPLLSPARGVGMHDQGNTEQDGDTKEKY